MKNSLLTCVVLVLVGSSVLMCSSSRNNGVSFPPRIAIQPRNARVFAGDSLQFYTTVVGALAPQSIRWSVIGPGTVDDNGLYRAADVPSSADIVASTGNGLAQSVAVRTVMPPSDRQPLILSTCYSDGTVNVNDARNFTFIGALSVGGRTAGITVNERQRRAIFAVESQIVVIDLRSMQWKVSAPLAGARFSEIAQLVPGYLAVTDNNAEAGHPGVRIYRINPLGAPVLVSSVVAGETPEGIIPTADGRGFYVSNINGNSIMRFAIDGLGRARLLATQKTATRPFGLALDPIHHLLFVADNDTSVISGAKARPGLERFDSTNLRRIGGMISTGSISSLPLGAAVDASIARLFVTNEGAGDVIVFALPSMRRIAALPTGLTPWLPMLDPANHRLYVPNARANTISIYDTKRLRIVASAISTCSYPTSVAVANAEGK
jgi:DNA-binding beta-propeller fold protein YncE